MHEATLAAHLVIDPEFDALLPPLTPHERALLTQSIERHGGCYEDVRIWIDPEGRHLVVDGMNRIDICRELFGPDDSTPRFDVVAMEFADREEVKDWIDTHQVSRRNLCEADKKDIRARILERRKQARGGDRKSKSHDETLIAEPVDTAQQVAEELGVSRATIYRDQAYKQAADTVEKHIPDIRQKVRSGEVTTADVQAAAREIIKKRIEGRPAEVKSPGSRDKSQEPEGKPWSVVGYRDSLDKWMTRIKSSIAVNEMSWSTPAECKVMREWFTAQAEYFAERAREC